MDGQITLEKKDIFYQMDKDGSLKEQGKDIDIGQ